MSFPLCMDLKIVEGTKHVLSKLQSLPRVPPFGQNAFQPMENLKTLLSATETPMRRKGRKILTYKDRTFRLKGKSFPIKGLPDYAYLCDIFYARCPKSDNKLPWEVVYKNMPSEYQNDLYAGREKIRGTIKSLNRWAKRNIGVPVILRLERGFVHRQ